ncbi:DNA-binding response regulator, OmpR family, contains REC and winged-helix (wHTH) domain [Robiginitalea myxolifaciens]|uniref:DNA-binding response regulator, OmpR family, contains REC and winged-helix (WHTH) domain n=1 Tax=Robiginitalea myxolifaciens TaxID=400055 RepID=A0A1I6FPD5_9FLAO|nr:response regulator transcription factor [Robiginitalea myxolifaciens]SFR31813.1 DNA-binding response regulator, OmpR family, contains REC and winged-helix (wHTH) domain [Robiginitalea myxolifaciens]
MAEQPYNIVLVEDDASLGYLLKEYLGMKGFEVRWIQDSQEVLPLLKARAFDLVILDVMMPGMDGFTLGEKIHKEHPGLPFLFLTARSMKIDVLKGFAVGAVDYLKKPIDEEELVVRIEALLMRLDTRTQASPQGDVMSLGGYNYDAQNQSLEFKGEQQILTKRENELLRFLAARPNRLSRHEDILKELWGRNDYFNRKSLNVFITRLRKYLANDPALRIENVHGQGFIFHVPREA